MSTSSEKPFMATPEGSGIYTQLMTMTMSRPIIDQATPIVMNIIKNISTDHDAGFVIGDYGCNDGGMSLEQIGKIVEYLRVAHGDGLPITVIYEDLPHNDFKSVFLQMQGFISGIPTYWKRDSNMYILASGTSFFSQCVAAESMDIILSYGAMHWLSIRPCPLTNAISYIWTEEESEIRQFKAQAASDWKANLLNRAKELKPGGYFVIGLFGGHEDLSKLQNMTFYQSGKILSDILIDILKEDLITKEEFANITLNRYFKSEEDVKLPFDDPQSPVSKAGLRLVSIETKEIQCPLRQKWINGEIKGKEMIEKHVRNVVGIIQPWMENLVRSALSRARSSAEQDDIISEIFERYTRLVTLNPGNYGEDVLCIYIVIRKVT